MTKADTGPHRVVIDGVTTGFPEAIVHAHPSDAARRINRVARVVVRPALRWAPLSDSVLRHVQGFDRESRPASDIEARSLLIGGVPGERMRLLKGTTSDLTILYLHGGGFFAGSVDSYRRLLERFTRRSGGTVYAVDYRQLPGHPLSVSVEDAISSYAGVREFVGADAPVVVAGDSAGGYLTMKVAELAQRRGMVVPTALIGFSPLLSVDPLSDKKGHALHIPINDAYLPSRRVAQIRKRWLPEGVFIEGFTDPFHAVSRIDVPTQIVAVEDEMLRPEAESFASRLAERGVPVEFHIWRGQVHAFPLLAGIIPDAGRAIDLAVEFAERVVEAGSHGDRQS